MHPIPFDIRQDQIDQMEDWRKSLPPSPVPPFLLGLKPRPDDPRDYDLRDVPAVAERLRVGFPESYDLVRQIKGQPLNQGSVPSCVSHTMAHMTSVHQQEEEGIWRIFDAARAHSETGPVNEGRWPDDLLKYCQQRGMPLANTESRYKIISYAFAPKVEGVWEQTIKAAIAADHPCPVCMLLPSLFGWESGGSITSGYHEVLIVGYRPDAFLIFNSWGSGWGRNGLGWVPIGYLTQGNFQNGYVISHTVTDEILSPQPQPEPDPQPQPDPQPEPDPQPQPQPTGVRIRGILTGGGLEMVKEGSVLVASGGGFSGNLQVEQIEGQPDPNPDPQPEPEPQPEPQPQPGDLTVEVILQRRQGVGGHWFSVKVEGPPATVTVKVLQGGLEMPLGSNAVIQTGSRWRGSYGVSGLVSGQEAVIRAEGDGHTGEKRLQVP